MLLLCFHKVAWCQNPYPMASRTPMPSFTTEARPILEGLQDCAIPALHTKHNNICRQRQRHIVIAQDSGLGTV